MKKPEFELGQVIDISYRNGGLPNRILIKAVYMHDYNNEWRYQVIMENSGETGALAESFIKNRKCSTYMPVYHLQMIQDRYKNGWRFCGNYDENSATSQGNLIANNENIKHVMLCPAINGGGVLIKDYYGIWIQYHNTISNDGNVVSKDGNDIVKIIK